MRSQTARGRATRLHTRAITQHTLWTAPTRWRWERFHKRTFKADLHQAARTQVWMFVSLWFRRIFYLCNSFWGAKLISPGTNSGSHTDGEREEPRHGVKREKTRPQIRAHLWERRKPRQTLCDGGELRGRKGFSTFTLHVFTKLLKPAGEAKIHNREQAHHPTESISQLVSKGRPVLCGCVVFQHAWLLHHTADWLAGLPDSRASLNKLSRSPMQPLLIDKRHILASFNLQLLDLARRT